MAQGAGTAIDVDDVRGKRQIAQGRHDDDGEGFVDFVKIDIRCSPAEFFQKCIDSADGGCGELGRRARVTEYLVMV